jgi:glycosyltransferase involved in cell wall biosynthesis
VSAAVPVVSIVTPVYNPPLDALKACIRSVLAQELPDWEWCICDDASTDSAVVAELDRLAAIDPRVRLTRHEVNGGIVAASNNALSMATADFVALLDHDDRLAPSALTHVVDGLGTSPDVDYLYSDEDKVGADGVRYDVFDKPDWSPERLRSQMYTGHLSVLRRSVVDEVGGFRAGFEGSQDHDLVLRVTERARTIIHVPHVLYSWAVVPGSAAGDVDAKPYAFEAGRRAVQEHCERTGIDAGVEFVPGPSVYRVRRRVSGNPLVSVIIPTRGSSSQVWGVNRVFVTELLRGIVESATYANLEFVVVYDLNTPDEVMADLAQICGARLVAVPYDRPFNFSQKINLGFLRSSGEYLLILNDDMELIDDDFVETLLALAQDPGVGCVGARLLFSDGTLQHAAHHYHSGEAYHVWYGAEGDDTGYFNSLVVQRETSGVTGACMMLSRVVYDEVGGMTELLPGSFNDVDFCLKVRAAGHRIIWTPWASLYHFESKSRDPRVTAEEVNLLRSRWGLDWDRDPYLASSPVSHTLPRGVRAAVIKVVPNRFHPTLKRIRHRLRR